MNQRLASATMLCGALLLLGCDIDRSVVSQSSQSQFELQKDAQGRTIRLNKITGEVVVVEGTQLIPVRRADETTTRTSPMQKPAARTPATKPVAGGETTAQRAETYADIPESYPQNVIMGI